MKQLITTTGNKISFVADQYLYHLVKESPDKAAFELVVYTKETPTGIIASYLKFEEAETSSKEIDKQMKAYFKELSKEEYEQSEPDPRP